MPCQDPLKISIIIPTLNEKKYLPLLLDSIKKQNFLDYEIIVADAGSRDRTVEIARKYGCQIVKGGSVARGRNSGARSAKGDNFLFLDADVILPQPDFLEKLFDGFKKRNLDVASFLISVQGNNIIDRVAYAFYNFFSFLTQSFLPHATEVILVKKEIHQKIGGFDEEIKIAEDHVYVRKAARFGKYGFLWAGPVLTSSRRFEQDGRLKTYLKYLLAGLYMLFFGPVKSDIFKYKFNHYSKNKK